MNKIIFIFFSFVLLTSCMQSSAMLGPAITGATSGNLYQTGLSYGANMAIEEKTGKTIIKHISNSYKENKEEKITIKRQEKLKILIKRHVQIVQEKLNKK